MAFTYTGFVDGIRTMTVEGVVRAYNAPPRRVAAEDLPLSYPRLPTAGNENAIVTVGTSTERGSVDLVIIVEALGLEKEEATFDAALALIDALAGALKTNAGALGVESWDIRQQYEQYGDTTYTVVVATITSKAYYAGTGTTC